MVSVEEKDNNKLIDEMIEIEDMLKFYQHNLEFKNQIERMHERIKNKIKIYLKERKWDRYKDTKSNISVTLSKQKRQNVDMEQLKYMLTESQLAQVINTIVFEKMVIITPKIRKRLSQYVRKNK